MPRPRPNRSFAGVLLLTLLVLTCCGSFALIESGRGHWLFALAILLMGLLVLSLVDLRRLERRREIGLCPTCGYDLRATPAHRPCAECGTPAPEKPASRGAGETHPASPKREIVARPSAAKVDLSFTRRDRRGQQPPYVERSSAGRIEDFRGEFTDTVRGTPRRPLMSMMTAAASLLVLLALVAAPAVATPGNDNRAPDLGEYGEKLDVDPGHKVAFHAYAAGVQIYRWNGTSWVFVAPEAYLFADAGGHGVVGIHYAGPTWESHGGSKVVGERVDGVNVDPTAIDWLLLRAKSAGGPGPFKDITFIQRVNTAGGRAPSEAGDFVGEEARVPYTAEYFFYQKHR